MHKSVSCYATFNPYVDHVPALTPETVHQTFMLVCWAGELETLFSSYRLLQ